MTTTRQSLKSPYYPTWCPGCGNFGVWTALKNALSELAYPEEQVVIVYGVGCSGNMADFNRVYGFHALHGRDISNAAAIKLANHSLKVIVVAGDGNTYGEGLNHFLSALRGNHDITILVHNNGVYGLTTGQAAPTTAKGKKTKSTPLGVPETQINPLGLALTCEATFVARGFSGEIAHLTSLIKLALEHNGTSFVDMFQPCFTFNHDNTYLYYREHVYNLQNTGHDTHNRLKAYEKTLESGKIPIGLFYRDENSVPFHKTLSQLNTGPLVKQSIENVDITQVEQLYM